MIVIGMSTTAATEVVTDGDSGKPKDLDNINNSSSSSNKKNDSSKTDPYASPGLPVVVPKDSSVNIVETDVILKSDALAKASSASLATAAAAAACVNHHSVVPDLMRVYESMTQTSSSGNSPAKNSSTNTNNNNNNELNTLLQPPSYADYLSQPPHHGTSTTVLPPHTAPTTQPYNNNYDPNDPTTTAAVVGNTLQQYYHGGAVAAPWGHYDAAATLSLAIPPPYSFPPPVAAAVAPYSTTAASMLPPSDNNNNNNSPADKNANTNNNNNTSGGGGRPVRVKRTMAAVDAEAGGGAAAGYDSSADGNSSACRGPNPKSRRKNNNKGGGGRKGSQHAPAAAAVEGKEDKNDGRWSKRFTWPDDLHRDFVSAIFDVGLKHASPSTVMEHMPPHEQITTERIKSHLQKYRLHRQKAKKEFMSSYQQTMEQIHTDGGVNNMTSLASGQVAAHLSYVSEHHPDPETEEPDDSDGVGRVATNEVNHTNDEQPKYPEETKHTQLQPTPVVPEEPTQDVFYLPKLTEAEKISPIGISLGYLMGLFFTLREQLDAQRLEQQETSIHAQPQEEQHVPAQQQLFDVFATEQEGRKMSATTLQNPTSVQSASRNNLEVNSLIKREMQSQMEFQNKMRALKQQELNKYTSKPGMDNNSNNNNNTMNSVAGSDSVHDHNTSDTRQSISNSNNDRTNHNKKHQDYQGAGEAGGADTSSNREHGVSLGEEDEFWNTSVVDDELFDFLMNS